MGQIFGGPFQFEIKDFIDILVVSLMFYQFLLVGQGTRAVQIVFSIIGLGVLYWLGQLFQYHLLNWILGHFFDYFFVIVVILFQDQIRLTLASFGNKKGLFGGLTRQEFENEVDEVSELCSVLSREKIGALMAFERSHGLLNYINTGTKLDCKVNSDILYSLFLSRSPLHDGAVIISQGRLAAAGCFLPLSKNVDIDKHMGTRHRAGLGLSEMTDAVVVVVSEETGQISICIQGRFYFCKDILEARQKIKFALMNLDGIDGGFLATANANSGER